MKGFDQNDFVIDKLFKKLDKKKGYIDDKEKKKKTHKKRKHHDIRDTISTEYKNIELLEKQKREFDNDPTAAILNDPNELNLLLNGFTTIKGSLKIVIPA